MIKKLTVGLIATAILFNGCGGGGSSGVIDEDMQKKNSAYLPYFADYLAAGVWVQYEYDENEEPKTNQMGIDFKYKFDSNGTTSMNISLIDQWIPLGEYWVDETQTQLTFEEGNTTMKQFDFIEHKEPMEISYKDENNETQIGSINCIKVAKYTIKENNTTLDDYYHLCKEL